MTSAIRFPVKIIFFLLWSGIFLIQVPTVASALGKPAHLKATYDPVNDKLVVQWDKVSGASKYKAVVKDGSGATVISSSTNGLVKKFAGSKFVANVEYSVKVQSLSGGSSSKFSSKSYIHTRARAEGSGPLLTKNSFGRGGKYYLPPKFSEKARPVMVAFHGQGGDGDSMVGAFSKFAKEFGFIIIAPSSGLLDDGTAAWQVGALPGTITDDFVHTENCMAEVLNFTGLKVNSSRILTVGYSAGGAVAPYYATNNPEFTHFAILHGGIAFGGLGDRIIPAWLSTGITDPLRTPVELQTYTNLLQALGFNVTFNTFQTDHALAQKELRGMVEWWLDK